MFEWDESKRQTTIQKHDLDFADVIQIFLGPHLVLLGRSEVESRKRAIGPFGGKMICVVFTTRGDDIRVITARVARKNERQAYQAIYP
jgi:uncharacterized protein